MNDGVIKFRCTRKDELAEMPDGLYARLEQARTVLIHKGWIGEGEDGIGFGNISAKSDSGSDFFISGSGTGGLKSLNPEHYVLVTGYKIDENRVDCTGLINASAETMSHAALYDATYKTGAVIHIHSYGLWKKLIHVCPTTPECVLYGTPEMAEALKNMAATPAAKRYGAIVMGGHPEGIIAFGKTLDEALQALLQLELT